MRNYNSYLPHTASKIVKTMTLPCAMCCSHCHMTLRLCQLPCGTVTCHCHVLLSLPHGTECTATAMWQKKVTTPPPIIVEVIVIQKNSILLVTLQRTWLKFYLISIILACDHRRLLKIARQVF